MSAITRYLGHVSIDPPLDQTAYDGLRAVTTGQVPLVVGDELEPWCPWGPCPHGCCLRWDGSDSHGSGLEGLQLLIDRLLPSSGPDAHDTNGVVVGEDEDRGLFLLRVEHGRVREERLLRGDPSPFEDGFEAGRRLPWLSPEEDPDERNRRLNAQVLARAGASGVAGTRKGGGRRRR